VPKSLPVLRTISATPSFGASSTVRRHSGGVKEGRCLLFDWEVFNGETGVEVRNEVVVGRHVNPQVALQQNRSFGSAVYTP